MVSRKLPVGVAILILVVTGVSYASIMLFQHELPGVTIRPPPPVLTTACTFSLTANPSEVQGTSSPGTTATVRYDCNGSPALTVAGSGIVSPNYELLPSYYVSLGIELSGGDCTGADVILLVSGEQIAFDSSTVGNTYDYCLNLVYPDPVATRIPLPRIVVTWSQVQP